MPNYLQKCTNDECSHHVKWQAARAAAAVDNPELAASITEDTPGSGARHVFEDIRLIAQRHDNPPCPLCGGVSERTTEASSVVGLVDPVVVYKGPDGQVRFPGHRDAAFYKSRGYEAIEIRGAHEMRNFEKMMNRHEYSRAERRTEMMQRGREQQQSVLRSHLRGLFTSMTRAGRDLAREAMRRNDHKPVERTREADFHSEIYSYDRGNREGSRGSDGRRMRD